MTAIGIVLTVVGYLICQLLGSKNYFTRTKADYIGALIALIGILMVALGLLLSVWRIMP